MLQSHLTAPTTESHLNRQKQKRLNKRKHQKIKKTQRIIIAIKIIIKKTYNQNEIVND